MESIPIRCAKCGNETAVVAGEGHTGILKCDCGATTTITGRPFDLLDRLKKMIPELINQWKAEKQRSGETGLDDALHEAAKKVALELLETDPDLKFALREGVEAALRQAFRSGSGHGSMDSGEEE